MFGLNPLATSFYPQELHPVQDVRTPFEASLHAYSFLGIHGIEKDLEQRLEAVEELVAEEYFLKEEEIQEQRNEKEKARRISLRKSKYEKNFEGKDRVEKVNSIRTVIPVARSFPVQPAQPVLVIVPVFIIVPVQVVYVIYRM